MFNTYGTWLRGDARGFRDHDHRIHSSGDYRNPPPPEQHAGLRRWTMEHMHKEPVRLEQAQRELVGGTIVGHFEAHHIELLAIAVTRDHVHGLGRFSIETKEKLVGNAKRASSHAIRAKIPGQVWARKCLFKEMRDEEHHRNTFRYITDHAREGAWMWTIRDAKLR